MTLKSHDREGHVSVRLECVRFQGEWRGSEDMHERGTWRLKSPSRHQAKRRAGQALVAQRVVGGQVERGRGLMGDGQEDLMQWGVVRESGW